MIRNRSKELGKKKKHLKSKKLLFGSDFPFSENLQSGVNIVLSSEMDNLLARNKLRLNAYSITSYHHLISPKSTSVLLFLFLPS